MAIQPMLRAVRYDLERVVEELDRRADILQKFETSPREGGRFQARTLRASMYDLADGLALNISFRTGGAAIEPQFRAQIEALVRILAPLPNISLTLDGHADTRGSRRFNRRLSTRRVEAVSAALVDGGLSPMRIVAQSHGECAALSPNGDHDGYHFDRRVVLTLRVPLRQEARS